MGLSFRRPSPRKELNATLRKLQQVLMAKKASFKVWMAGKERKNGIGSDDRPRTDHSHWGKLVNLLRAEESTGPYCPADIADVLKPGSAPGRHLCPKPALYGFLPGCV